MTALIAFHAFDPYVFGDNLSTGQLPDSAGRPLPPPGQLAGVVRSWWGADARGRFVEKPEEALRVRVSGPFVALLDRQGGVADWLLPAPADAVRADDGIHRCLPLEVPEGALLDDDDLAPVGPPAVLPGKPRAPLPFWGWRDGMLPWLARGEPPSPAALHPGPLEEARTHVVVDPGRGAAAEGLLFAVRGHRWLQAGRDGVAPLALVAAVDEEVAARVAGRTGTVGGEGRLARAGRLDEALPEPPPEVIASARLGAVRLVLATPGWFHEGWRPADLFADAARAGVKLELVAAAHDRPEVVSGWDLARGRPKPTRRLLPAGSVLFLRLAGEPDARERWARSTWLAPVSDREPGPSDQPRRDGYGVALLGAWDGKLAPLA